ncbi:MAG: hypothetical protein ACK4RN_12185 [Pseudorhodobacter sp.]
MIAGLHSGAKLTGGIRSSVGGRSHHQSHPVAISIGLAMVPVVSEGIFRQRPDLLQRFFHSGVLVGTSAALLRSLLFNGILPRPSEEVLDDDGALVRESV